MTDGASPGKWEGSYRGYRYANETGLYYLQSRYYNPDWGRFINADAIAGQVGELLGHNIFAYCKNNPVNMKDPAGFRPVYSVGLEDETDEMYEASLAEINSYRDYEYENGFEYNNSHIKQSNIGQKVLHKAVDKTAKFIKENKVEIAVTIACGGYGAVIGATKKQA